uniref:Kunitz/Bovine pancreatic trypsin inhibitor domain protein n=1 Tax=Bursaphelenchus xylophilus TaxID=6326 RepID=A0A1I7SAP0_BURXY
MRKPLNDLLVCLTHFLLCFKFTQAFETVTHADTSPNNVSSGLAGKAMRHYAVPPYTGSGQPQLYAVQPQYPQYYFGPQPQNPCLLPQQVGTGPYRIPRWYFNPARQACELFYWSGCCGNSNNFQTYHDCQKRCEGGNAAKPNTVVFVPFTLTFTMKPTGNTNLQPLPTAQTANCQSGDCPKGHIAGSGAPLVPITPVPRFIPVTPSSPHLPPPVPTAQLRPIPAIESPSPCAYGDLTPANQPLQCQPGTTVAQTCGGEQFCHIGASPQTTVCCPKPADLDPCGQPMSTGVGNANLQRWYFNSMAQQCQPLQYRGLQGNENNFLTQNACQAQCQVNPCRVGIPFRNTNGMLAYCAANDASECPTGYYCHIGANAQTSVCCQALEINPCKEPKIEGEGLARQVRYYFDVERKECLPFEYRGLKGNPNNFVSKTACERRCPVWVNPCAKGQPILDVTNKPELCHLGRPCPQNYYCHIGFNDETTVCCPASSTNPCTVPLNQGMGYHIINRWYYNSATRQCERFVYKGSHGNENNFLVRDQCEATCPSFPNPCPTGEPLFDEKGVLPRLCNPQEESSCPATYFCHFGQTNTTRVCCPGKVDPCLLARSKGEGPYAETRWYFDISLKQCLPFEFFGMKGNGNNFATKADCERACPVFADPCPDSFTMDVLGVQYHSNIHYQKCDIDTHYIVLS